VPPGQATAWVAGIFVKMYVKPEAIIFQLHTAKKWVKSM
jgi:hypothetical protein